MNCTNCHEPLEEDAAYCGNCGQSTKGTYAALGATSLSHEVPAYALTLPAQHDGEMQALASVLLGAAGLAGAMLIPVIGLSLGLLGIVTGTTKRVYTKKTLRIAGLFLSSIAILAGLASWVHAVSKDPRYNSNVARSQASDPSVIVGADFATPCYSLNFVDELNIKKDSNSCNISAFNGTSLDTSTNAYKVYANDTVISNTNDFMNQAKPAVEKDVAQNMPGFKITDQKVSTFAGSPAYVVNVSDAAQKVSMVEAVVFHKVSNGKNVFVLIHANSGPSADLQIMESQWQWN